MGCCGSGHEEAKESEVLPPEPFKALKCKLKSQGTFDADYNVLDLTPESEKDGKPPIWMLLDAVGGWSDGYQFFLKHRSPGEEHSKILALADVRQSLDYLEFQVRAIPGRA